MFSDITLDTLSRAGWALNRFEERTGFYRQNERKIQAFTLPIALKVTFAAGSALLSLWEPIFIPAAAIFSYFSIRTIRKKMELVHEVEAIIAQRKKVFYIYEVMRVIRQQKLALIYATSYTKAKKQAKELLESWKVFPLGALVDKTHVESALQALVQSKKQEFLAKKTAAQDALEHMASIGRVQGPLAAIIQISLPKDERT